MTTKRRPRRSYKKMLSIADRTTVKRSKREDQELDLVSMLESSPRTRRNREEYDDTPRRLADLDREINDNFSLDDWIL